MILVRMPKSDPNEKNYVLLFKSKENVDTLINMLETMEPVKPGFEGWSVARHLCPEILEAPTYMEPGDFKVYLFNETDISWLKHQAKTVTICPEVIMNEQGLNVYTPVGEGISTTGEIIAAPSFVLNASQLTLISLSFEQPEPQDEETSSPEN